MNTKPLPLSVMLAGVWLFGLIGALNLAGASSRNSPIDVITVCLQPGCDYETIQAAVSGAPEGAEIRVLTGIYTGVQHRAELDDTEFTAIQVVAITRTVSIRGGFAITTVNSGEAAPDLYPTIVDAEGAGRGFAIIGNNNSVIEGIRVTGGNATGLGGGSPSLEGKHDGGGGFYVLDAHPEFVNLWVDNNTAQDGGGFFLSNSDSIFRAVRITTNTAEYRGAGIYSYQGPLHMRDSQILNNILFGTYSEGGGAYLLYSDSTLIDSEVRENVALQSGGGLYLSNCDSTLAGNLIEGNDSLWSNGGGLNVLHSNTNLEGNTIRHNQCRYEGGGLVLFYNSQITMTGNIITGNIAGRHGGGASLRINRARLVNNVFAENQAGWNNSNGRGAGLHVAGATVQLVHNSLVDNTGREDIGIYITDKDWANNHYTSTVSMSNTLIAGQAVGISVTHEISSAIGSALLINGILWHHTPVTIASEITATVTVQEEWTGDPLFVDSSYHIGSSSAAINRGIQAGISLDIDREPRILPDLGADEYWEPGTLRQVFLPFTCRN